MEETLCSDQRDFQRQTNSARGRTHVKMRFPEAKSGEFLSGNRTLVRWHKNEGHSFHRLLYPQLAYGLARCKSRCSAKTEIPLLPCRLPDAGFLPSLPATDGFIMGSLVVNTCWIGTLFRSFLSIKQKWDETTANSSHFFIDALFGFIRRKAIPLLFN